MLVVAAVPAIAERNRDLRVGPLQNQNLQQDSESGDLEQSSVINATGDNSNVCAAPQITGNTGSVQQQQAVQQGAFGDRGGNGGNGGRGGNGDADTSTGGGQYDNGAAAAAAPGAPGERGGHGGRGGDAAVNGEFEFGDASLEVGGSQEVTCNGTVDQTAVAN